MFDIHIPPTGTATKRRLVDPVIATSMGVTLFLMGAVFLFMHGGDDPMITGAVGGPDRVESIDVQQMSNVSQDDRIRRLRTKQAVLTRREEILRSQLRQLTDVGSEDARRSRNTLVMLLKDQENTNEALVEFLRQVWEADGKTRVATMGMETADRILISWPASPERGISADFGDPVYFEHFGIPHEAVDIPLLQGSDVRAAADGVVSVVADNNLGYNYLIIRHKGFATLYGHVSEFLVQPGQEVHEGDIVARSGGLPGTPGAGAMTTGSHLHFELIAADGKRIDPLPYLPYSSTVQVVHDWATQ